MNTAKVSHIALKESEKAPTLTPHYVLEPVMHVAIVMHDILCANVVSGESSTI